MWWCCCCFMDTGPVWICSSWVQVHALRWFYLFSDAFSPAILHSRASANLEHETLRAPPGTELVHGWCAKYFPADFLRQARQIIWQSIISMLFRSHLFIVLVVFVNLFGDLFWWFIFALFLFEPLPCFGAHVNETVAKFWHLSQTPLAFLVLKV